MEIWFNISMSSWWTHELFIRHARNVYLSILNAAAWLTVYFNACNVIRCCMRNNQIYVRLALKYLFRENATPRPLWNWTFGNETTRKIFKWLQKESDGNGRRSKAYHGARFVLNFISVIDHQISYFDDSNFVSTELSDWTSSRQFN